MKIEVEESVLKLKEVFSGILLETDEGNRVGICMRDDTFEINVMPNGVDTGEWWRVNMQTSAVERMLEPKALEELNAESKFNEGEKNPNE